MPPDILTTLAQFGVAGVIACMWILERRSASARERELTQAHDRVLGDRERLGVLVELVASSSRAMTGLEASQRDIARSLDRLSDALDRREQGASLARGAG